jgi:aerobic carbon-monoxide dehydrogenase medium subunit
MPMLSDVRPMATMRVNEEVFMQVPAPFEYERATSVEHALSLLARRGDGARLLAGGHSLIPMMKLRLASPELLIDINDLTELSYLRIDGAELCVGALTRHAELLASPLVAEHFPIFRDAERVIADPIVRNWGTVGGSLCQADPAEDLSAAFSAVGATAVMQSAAGLREIPIRQFHVGAYETALAPAELLREIRVPIRGGSSAYVKVERRAGDWGVAAVGAAVWLAGDVISDVGIGLTAVHADHFCAPAAEDFLRGREAGDANFAEAGRLASQACHPVADQRGPVDYKRHLVGELTARALRRATTRARGLEV